VVAACGAVDETVTGLGGDGRTGGVGRVAVRRRVRDENDVGKGSHHACMVNEKGELVIFR